MNLIKDEWIPVYKKDGSKCIIRPEQLVDDYNLNPIVDFAVVRNDLLIGARFFLLALIQTLYQPKTKDELKQYYHTPPKLDFTILEPYFNLFGDGPCFMQDYNPDEVDVKVGVSDLFLGQAGIETINGNTDIFFPRGQINHITPEVAALQLMTLLQLCPQGGGGHRVGLRGGGALTTFVTPNPNFEEVTLWKKLYINVLDAESFPVPSVVDYTDIFPWMKETVSSKNNKFIYPNDVNPLTMFWSVPKRIRLIRDSEESICSITGVKGKNISYINKKIHGNKYDGFIHPYSPYRRKKDGTFYTYSTPKQYVSYAEYVDYTLGIDEVAKTAQVMENKELIEYPLIHVFGYATDKTKVLNFVDKISTIYKKIDRYDEFIDSVKSMYTATIKTTSKLNKCITKIFPKKHIRNDFLRDNEEPFFILLDELYKYHIEPNANAFYIDYYNSIKQLATEIFERYTSIIKYDDKKMKKVCTNRVELEKYFNDKNTKKMFNVWNEDE